MSDSVAARSPREGWGARLRGLALYLLMGSLVAGAVLALGALQGAAEAGVAGAAGLVPLGYGFAAGMVASVNPCGFILLPSYLSFQLGTQDAGYAKRSTLDRAASAVVVGSLATAGFVLVFGGAGLVLSAGGEWLSAIFPHLGVLVGLAMAGLGVWLLITHQTLGLNAATRIGTPAGNAFLFGVAYAVGSLGCTLPIFLVVAGGAMAGLGPGPFVSYALGMGMVLIAVSLSAALFRGAIGRALRGVVPHVHRLSAMFLVAAGGYLVYYWGVYARY